ncbi:MAG: HAD family hydrolase [Oscillospiraceae bacterium]|nr:HAD family hydrolase [Oscillospiraceae bacterium]
MRDYGAYIFDLYGTLIDIHTDEEDGRLWTHMAEIYSRFGAAFTAGSFRETYLRFCAEAERELRGRTGVKYPEIRLDDVFLRLYRDAPRRRAETTLPEDGGALWIPFAAAAFRAISLRRLRVYPHTLSTLRRLRESGRRVYLLSNAQRLFTVPELERFSLDACFDAIYLSSDAGMAKPEPAFLEKLLREQGLDREDCVMVGNDWSSDMLVAASCGVDGVYLNTGGHSEAEIRKKLPEGRFELLLSGDLAGLLPDAPKGGRPPSSEN